MSGTPRQRGLEVGGNGITREELPPLDAGPVSLHDWFAPSWPPRPLELEIGSGKGTFLINQAAAQPEVNYIGLEYARAFWRYAADRCRRHDLSNVRVVRIEGGVFVRNYVPDNTFGQVHIYFPDPWPKKRHHKRRLIQTPFLRELHRILLGDADAAEEQRGRVRLVTDHAAYFEWMQEHAAATEELFERLPCHESSAAGEKEWVGTNFERKYRREGRSFYRMVLRKRPTRSR